ncbi:MAG: plasmid mobilization relaxosome protein MobC [Clostridia bacterium]|nr:plasmid mobilization relaxosome protein MobC [Clostridia bacterium]
MAQRERSVSRLLRLTPQENAMLEQRIQQSGIKNREAFMRKMLLEGYVLSLELPELKEILRLTRYTSNNVNQIARHSHETGRYYIEDIEQMVRNQEAIQDALKEVLNRLSALE